LSAIETSRGTGRRDLLVSFVFLAVVIAIPIFFPSRYILGQGVTLFLWATVVSQWNIVFGVAGIFSLAQMAIFALGGYIAAMLALYLGVSLWIGMFIGGLAAVLFSLVIGMACIRLKGAYVALLTLAIVQAMYLLIITDTDCFMKVGVTCRNFTGGTRGMSQFGDFGFGDLFGRQYIAYGNYFLALAVLMVSLGFAYWVIHSPIGLAFKALRDNKLYAIGRGVGVMKFQLIIFGISAFFTGMAGAVFAGNYRVIGANVLELPLMLYLLSMMVIGGLGTFWGPLAGAVCLVVFDEFLKEIGEWRLAGLGMLLMLSVIFMPKGIVGVVNKLRGQE